MNFKTDNGQTFTLKADNYQQWVGYHVESVYQLDVNRVNEPQWASLRAK